MPSKNLLKGLKIVAFVALVLIAFPHISHIVAGGKTQHFMEVGTFAALSLIPLGLLYRTSRQSKKKT